ncbi:hypothetical protein [Wolbachia endosymbiont of Mansonella perstans]|uniref:hypothetical protein n=1 Tax=Wolbachia endosymbiont of Mansonella perstans TaxID=229526 RepID=UPI001CE0520D|nr:hypothetical protein [Wolbachia endosymbiont of Mansonella perstans]MCA4773724.1 hypothetical protein [Wolbachia endosymbiont of Mansonella perstans]
MFNSKENLILQGTSQDKHKLDDNLEIQNILLDFEKLDFENNPCSDALNVINYNEGKEANPFDKIAKYYGRKKNVFLFIDVVFHKEKEIMDIISKKCNAQVREKFRERMKIYSDRIGQGVNDAKEFLNSDLAAFFNGYHVACPGHNRNIHENLNINITKPGQTLETSSFFSKKIKRIEEEKSEVKRAKIYSNGKRVVTIEKSEEQQRNYSFTKFAICDIEISWSAKDEFKKDLNCTVVLSVNSGQVSVKKSVIDGKDVEPKDILELAKQNGVALIGGKTLHEVLGECLVQQTPREEKENIQSREHIIVGVPSSAIDKEVAVEEGISSPQQGAAVNN